MASKKKPAVRRPAARDPRTGKFVKATAANLRRIAKAVARDYRKAVGERNKWARKRHEGAKQPSTLRRYDKAYRAAARRAARLADKAIVAQSQVPVKRTRLPQVMEVGLDYEAAKGTPSDVNINIRIRRTDGQGISEADAKRAIVAIAQGEAELPDDLEVSAVRWQRPQKVSKRGAAAGWRSGEPEDVFSFSSILAHVVFNENGEGLRFGHVKADEL